MLKNFPFSDHKTVRLCSLYYPCLYLSLRLYELLLPFSTFSFSVIFSGISLLPLLAPALISIISPEIFRVIVPPEIIEISKRIALLPRDLVRIINGLAHIPFDLMRSIAVLDENKNRDKMEEG